MQSYNFIVSSSQLGLQPATDFPLLIQLFNQLGHSVNLAVLTGIKLRMILFVLVKSRLHLNLRTLHLANLGVFLMALLLKCQLP